MAVSYKVKQRKSSIAGNKYYPFVQYGTTVDRDTLAGMIEKQCTATVSDVQAVLTALVDVMTHELENGNRVLLDGFGYFYITVLGSGADTAEAWTVEENLRGVRCRFLPVGRRVTGQKTVSRAFTAGVKLKRVE